MPYLWVYLPLPHLYKSYDVFEGSNSIHFPSPNLTCLCGGCPWDLRNLTTGTCMGGLELSTYLLLQPAPGHHWALTRCRGRPADGSYSCSFQCLSLPGCWWQSLHPRRTVEVLLLHHAPAQIQLLVGVLGTEGWCPSLVWTQCWARLTERA